MKTRIVWTKIWEDEWFDSLSQDARWLFIYLLTTPAIGLSGCFEVRDKTILYHTHLTEKQLLKAKGELYPKVKFFENWVYMPNAQGYNGYVGDKNAIALEKEIKIIPQKIKDTLFSENTDTLSIPHAYTSDTSINHKSEIINNNNNNKYNTLASIKDNDIQEVANKYQVNFNFVKNVFEELELYCGSKGKKYADYKLTLMAWVRRKAEEQPQKRLKDLEPHQIEDLRLHPEKLSIYTKAGYDTSRI